MIGSDHVLLASDGRHVHLGTLPSGPCHLDVYINDDCAVVNPGLFVKTRSTILLACLC